MRQVKEKLESKIRKRSAIRRKYKSSKFWDIKITKLLKNRLTDRSLRCSAIEKIRFEKKLSFVWEDRTMNYYQKKMFFKN